MAAFPFTIAATDGKARTGVLATLRAKGVGHAFVTLHVGAGTFLPVKTDDVADHRMHPEYGEVDAATAGRLNAARAAGGRIVCVGTTSLRLVESAAGEDGVVRPFAAETAIFITPGYRFRAADVLMTNFHLPRSRSAPVMSNDRVTCPSSALASTVASRCDRPQALSLS